MLVSEYAIGMFRKAHIAYHNHTDLFSSLVVESVVKSQLFYGDPVKFPSQEMNRGDFSLPAFA